MLRRGGVYDTIQAGIRYWWDGELNQEADAQEIRRNPYAGPEALLTAPGGVGGAGIYAAAHADLPLPAVAGGPPPLAFRGAAARQS